MEEKFLQKDGQRAERNLPFRTKRASSNSSAIKSFDGFEISFLKGRNTFGKDEKLKNKKITCLLFNEGKPVSANGFTLICLFHPLPTFYPAQVGFSVPKKNFKNAVDRNQIKRLMREAYRLNKIGLYEKLAERKQQLAMIFIYKGKEIPDYKTVAKGFVNCTAKIVK